MEVVMIKTTIAKNRLRLTKQFVGPSVDEMYEQDAMKAQTRGMVLAARKNLCRL